jgi:hypothetical protein
MNIKPEPLTIKQLNQESTEYAQYSSTWRTVTKLKEGYPSIQKDIERFLPKRPVEDDELYKLRTAKLAYSPILSNIVSVYTGKMNGAPIHFPENTDPIWEQFRNNNSQSLTSKRDERTLLSEVFSEILSYGRCYTMVDVPKEATEMRSSYELRQSKLLPYLTYIPVLDVINKGDNWYVLRQYQVEQEPFQSPKTYAVYTYLGVDQVLVYKIEVQLKTDIDIEGNSYPTIARVFYKGEFQAPDDTMTFIPTSEINGTGADRIVYTEVSEDKWLSLALANKQIQHLRIENAWTDAGYLSGTIQRVFTPADPVGIEDPRVSYDEDSVKAELTKAGNQHILVGKGYSFVESSGKALGNLEMMLDKIEKQMAKIANLGFIAITRTSVEQSGVSKKADMMSFEAALSEYGNTLIDYYNNLLLRVAALMRLSPVVVTGLNDFDSKEPDKYSNAVQVVAGLPDFPIESKMQLYNALMNELGLEGAIEMDSMKDSIKDDNIPTETETE